MAGYDLSDYIDVKQRVKMLYDIHPDARIVTSPPQLMPGRTDMIYIIASVYRSTDDLIATTGMAAELVEGKTSFTRNSELMNCETSAIGRAIANMGIGITKSMASLNEVVRQQEMEKTAPKKPVKAPSKPVEPELDPWGQPVIYEPENEDVGLTPDCKHGSMEWKSGVGKTGKPYSGWVCTAPREEQCPAQWN